VFFLFVGYNSNRVSNLHKKLLGPPQENFFEGNVFAFDSTSL